MPSFFAPVPTQRNRRVSAVLTSAAMHGALLALVLVAGKALKNRVMEPTTQYQFISMVENAGAAHASKFPLPPMDLNAQKRHPDPSPEVTHKSLLPVENARPRLPEVVRPPIHTTAMAPVTRWPGTVKTTRIGTPPFRSSRRIPR